MTKTITRFRLLCAILIMLMLAVVAPARAAITATAPSNGTGTTAAPYQISTAGELYWFAEQVNGGQYTICAKLTADIVLNNSVVDADGNLRSDYASANLNEWSPIGTNTSYPFKGTFDGDGHIISGLYYSKPSVNYAGLFGAISGATICNVTVKDSYVCGGLDAGAIVGNSNGSTITNCHNHNTTIVGKSNRTGGISGYLGSSSKVTLCSNSGNVSSTGQYIGGVSGTIEGSSTMENCFNCGKVTTTSSNVGGVTGWLSGTLKNCFNYGKVTANSYVAGVLGYYYSGTISNTYYLAGCAVTSGGSAGFGIADRSSDDSQQTMAADSASFASGAVCVKLNYNVGDASSVWRQTLGADGMPSFSGSIVYVSEPCPTQFGNSQQTAVAHTYDADGFCSACGKAKKPNLNGDVYEIATRAELMWFADTVNSGATSLKAQLVANIVLNDSVVDAEGNLRSDYASANLNEWPPIGTNTSYPFKGTFDGDGHTISGLYYSKPSVYYAGLFGAINGATICNVTVKDSYVCGSQDAGAIVGNSSGSTITNCHNQNTTIVGKGSRTGGISGYLGGSSKVTLCSNTGNVSSNSQYIGGVSGTIEGSSTMENCFNSGNVTTTSSYAGGVSGWLSGTLKNCLNYGKVTASGTIGGVLGQYSSGTISNNCYLAGCAATRGGTVVYGIANRSFDDDQQTMAADSAMFASGAVCVKLNNNVGDASSVWRQDIGADSTPSFSGSIVYASKPCPAQFGNSQQTAVAHTYDADGFCSVCGEAKKPNLNGDVYEIASYGELVWFADTVNSGATSLKAQLVADIVVNDSVINAEGKLRSDYASANLDKWSPIGVNSDKPFKGTFDGDSHTISGLYYSNSNDDYIGFIGYAEGATIKNVVVKDSYFKGDDYVGFIGYAVGATIKNVVVKDSYFTGDDYVAGICAYSTSSTTITNCGYEGYVYGWSSTPCGITYIGSATVTNCYSVSNQPLARATVANCYHDNIRYSGSDSYSIGKPSSAFASGEVAWLLGEAWGQKIGTDATPVLGGDKVYPSPLCPHTNSYNNTDSVYTPIPEGAEHYNANGFCKVCGAGHPATLVGGYYEIDDVAKLVWFAAQVAGGQTTIKAKLTADIVLNDLVIDAEGNLRSDYASANLNEWSPIGSSTNNPFKGTFDGDGHTISGLYYSQPSVNYAGLFGAINGATICNVTIKDSYVCGKQDVGAIVGNVYGSTITNCHNQNTTIVGNSYRIGGISGFLGSRSKVTLCSNSGNVSSTGQYVGGVSGTVEGSSTMENCFNRGNVTTTNNNAGGITGWLSGTLKNCFNYGKVTANSYVAGVIGYYSSGTISNTYYLSGCAVTRGGSSGFGIAGQAADDIQQTTAVDSEKSASGEVAWLLNGGGSDGAWGQKIGTDATPVLGGDKVYAAVQYIGCEGYNSSTFNNAGSSIVERDHVMSNGLCTQCGFYFISTADQLFEFAAKVNGGQTTLKAKLAADIVVNNSVLKPGTFNLNGTPEKVWTPIGNSSYYFKGTFDGNGHTISGLYYNNSSNDYIGLIGYASGATIKNVVVKDSYFSGDDYVAGVCAYSIGSTTITNCGYEGCVYGWGVTACGISYNYDATVKYCYSVSNKPLASNATTNCYHDNTKYSSSSSNSLGKSSSAFASGEVAWLLNGGSNNGAWGQTIGTNATPKLGGDKVYATAICPHTNSYSNTASVYTPIANGDEHYDANGFCKVCATGGHPATLVDDYYEISNVGELYWFAAQVNAGQTSINAKLTADIVVNNSVLKPGTFDLNGTPEREWTSIGNKNNSYSGTFDGNNHTISGLYYSNYGGNSYTSLIGRANGATIKNVVVKDSYLKGYQYTGGICGYSTGSTTITNCGYEGYISGSSYYYGITCIGSATVENCYSVSNQSLADAVTTNCYHDNTKYAILTSNSIGKPSSAFASGEVAWLLGDAWGQKIGTDVMPVLGGDKVYATAICPHANSYGNTECVNTPIAESEDYYNSEGFCTVCGAGHPATLANEYYEIDDAGKLFWFAAQVNAGKTSINAKLTADIVVNDSVLVPETFTLNGTPKREWTSIGNKINTYSGTFDGNNHTISGLYYSNYNGNSYTSLIGYASGATIKNVVVKDSYLKGNSYTAGICGYSTGSTTITNCGYEGYVSGSSYYYGISCNGSAVVENCYSVSNQPLAYTITTNCYHDNTKYTGTIQNSIGKQSTAFASGEVAYLLGDAWGQKIGTDVMPVLGGDKVYCTEYTVCVGYTNFNNVGPSVVEERAHSCDADGVCTQCGYFLISTADELLAFATKVNGGQTTINAKLIADIVLNDLVVDAEGNLRSDYASANLNEWSPIGVNTDKPFKGTFDGDGHTISGLYYSKSSVRYAGLFGAINGATICNVTVKDSYVCGSTDAGAIVGNSKGSTITNCHNLNTTIVGNGNRTGGISGYLGGSKVTLCSNSGNVSSNSQYIGGVTGTIEGSSTMENCFNSGNVTTTSSYAGGISGYLYGILKNCFNYGQVTASSWAGGVLGRFSGGSIGNTYYLADCAYSGGAKRFGISGTSEDDNQQTMVADSAKLASGEICFLLNNSVGNSTSVWRQTLGEDSVPNFSGSIVYLSTPCAKQFVNDTTIAMPHTYGDGHICPICGKHATIDSLVLLQLPKTNYKVGDTLDITGSVIVVTFNDLVTDTLPLAVDMVSGFVSNMHGSYDVTVTYGGKSTTFAITVEHELKNIAIEAPQKTQYKVGDKLDLTGGKVTLTYTDSCTETLSLTADMVSGFASNLQGSFDVTLTYGDKTITYAITVEHELKNIAIEAPQKTQYKVGDKLDITGGKVVITYTDNTTETLSLTEDMVSGFSTTKAGEVVLTVTYMGQTFTYTIVVEEGQSIAEMGADAKVYAINRNIVVELQDADGSTISVFNISGRKVAQCIANSNHTELTMPVAGMYIVSVGNTVSKVVVK